MRHQAGPQVRRPRPPRRGVSAYGSFHGRTLATLHATGQPAKHEPFQPLPEGFRHVAWDDLDALEAAIDPSVAAVLLEPVQGEGGVNPASRRVLRRRAPAVRRAGPADHGRRGPDRPRPHRPVVRLPAPGRRPRRGDDGQGAGQRRADRRLLGPARRRRGLRARRPRHAPTAAQPLATAAARAVLATMERRSTRPTGAARAGAPADRRAGGAARRGRRPGLRPAAGGRAGRARRPGGRRRAARPPAWSSTRSPPPRCAWRRR